MLCEYFKRARFYNSLLVSIKLLSTPTYRAKFPTCRPNKSTTCNYRSFLTSRTKLPSCNSKLPVSSCFSLPQSSCCPPRCQKSMITFKAYKWHRYRSFYSNNYSLKCPGNSFPLIHLKLHYPARARSARARRACALRALGLLLADGTPTVGGGKTF